MKLIDKLNDFIAKVGTDKVIHGEMGGWITAIVIGLYATLCNSFYAVSCIKAIAIALTLVFTLSVVKEILDNKYDWKDVEAAMIASGGTSVVFLVFTLFKYL